MYEFIKIENTEAKCLDGSSPGFYYKKGSDLKKFILFFSGGGWCGTPIRFDQKDSESLEDTIQSCLERSQTLLGTSNYYLKYMPFDIIIPFFGPIFSIINSDPKINKLFSSYTVIFLTYCDGTIFQGYKKDPIKIGGKEIWFRGTENVNQIINYGISNLQLAKADQIIISGFSAGGAATLLWADEIKNKLIQINPSLEVLAIQDSGMFLDLNNYQLSEHAFKKNLKFIDQITHSEKIMIPNKKCYLANQNSQWRCFLGEEIIKHVDLPLFTINSLYDSYQINYLMGIKCLGITEHDFDGSLSNCNKSEIEHIEEQRQSMIDSVQKSLQIKKQWGAWLPSCVNHVYTMKSYLTDENYKVQGYTLADSIQQWLKSYKDIQQKQIVLIDNPWPSNSKCSRQIEKNDL